MSQQQQDFKTFMQERQQVAAAYVSGDAGPLGRIVAQQSPASFMSPGGGVVKGTQAVWSRYEKDAGRFEPGSTTEPRDHRHGGGRHCCLLDGYSTGAGTHEGPGRTCARTSCG